MGLSGLLREMGVVITLRPTRVDHHGSGVISRGGSRGTLSRSTRRRPWNHVVRTRRSLRPLLRLIGNAGRRLIVGLVSSVKMVMLLLIVH